ncbi:MAG: type II toxin-antitoxin system prevent-host-death family antitoxin [Verrucomicrobiota bacterium]
MSTPWKLADAKNRFSELVNNALSEGPQVVERRGDRVVVISNDEYEKLTGKKPDFIEFLMNGPSLEGVDLERSKDPMREVKL